MNTKGPIKCEHNKQGNRCFLFFLAFQSQNPCSYCACLTSWSSLLALTSYRVSSKQEQPGLTLLVREVASFFWWKVRKTWHEIAGYDFAWPRNVDLLITECISTGLRSLKSFVIDGQPRLRNRTINQTCQQCSRGGQPRDTDNSSSEIKCMGLNWITTTPHISPCDTRKTRLALPFCCFDRSLCRAGGPCGNAKT